MFQANISAAKAVADIIRTTLGPRSMLKMLLDAGGGQLFGGLLCLMSFKEHLLSSGFQRYGRFSCFSHAGIVLSNDGHAILRELDVAHPAAKVLVSLLCPLGCKVALTL